MTRFKPGDRVVVTSDKYFITKQGWTGEALYFRKNWLGHDEVEVFFAELNESHEVLEEDLELEAVYRSPLYKALK